MLFVCEDKLKLNEGFEFNSLEECDKFYKIYGYYVGFSIWELFWKESKDGVEKYK